MKALADGSAVDAALVESFCTSCPAFTLPAILRLQRCKDLTPDEEQTLRRRVALGVSSPDSLYDLIGYPGADSTPFYPPEKPPVTPATENAIDIYLENFGHSDPAQDELLERMIFNPTPEYASVLEQEYGDGGTEPESLDELAAALKGADGDQSPQRPQGLQESQSSRTPPPPPPAPALAPAAPLHAPAAEDSLSESLARIYIRQGKFEDAYQILSDLNLKNPKKSIYFASQLRFLRKLIANQPK